MPHAAFIPATESTPATRQYACGCTYQATTGWSHCHAHTDVHGVLVAASKASQAAARDVAHQAASPGPRKEVRECHGGTMTLYHYDRPSWESKEDRP